MMLIGLDKSGQKSDIYHTARQERRKPKGEIQMKNKKYYIAYGSNLSVEQMAYRCPDAKIAGQAVLAGWELFGDRVLVAQMNWNGMLEGAVYGFVEDPEEGWSPIECRLELLKISDETYTDAGHAIEWCIKNAH